MPVVSVASTLLPLGFDVLVDPDSSREGPVLTACFLRVGIHRDEALLTLWRHSFFPQLKYAV